MIFTPMANGGVTLTAQILRTNVLGTLNLADLAVQGRTNAAVNAGPSLKPCRTVICSKYVTVSTDLAYSSCTRNLV